MAKHSSGDITNVCIVGHGDAGKTTIADALLHKSGAVKRRGSVKDKTSVFDFDDLEREKQHSIDSAVSHLEWQGTRVNLIDTPGYPDYIGDAMAAIYSVNGILICVNALNGVQVNTRRTFEEAEKLGKSRIIVVNKVDLPETDFDKTLAEIRNWFGDVCIPITLPDTFGPGFSKTTRLLKEKGGDTEQGKEFFQAFVEGAVESDDVIMEKYLAEEEITPEELKTCFVKAVKQGIIVPIVFTSMESNVGLEDVLDAMVDLLPRADSPRGRRIYDNADGEGEGTPIEMGESADMYGQVFKIQVDKHIGKISFVRIYSGTMKSGDTFHNSSGGRKEKVGHIMIPMGKDLENTDQAIEGEIVVLTKIDSLSIGDTITSADGSMFLPPIRFPTPMSQVAVRPKSRADETKISESLNKLAAEVPTFTLHRDSSTHESIASGMSSLQLDTVFRRLKDRYGIEVETSVARIPYHETITAGSNGHYRHKKQSGGRGQFGEVYLKVAPVEAGTGLKFEWAIVGGSIPTNFGPAIEKGVREKMINGVIAGYPIHDIEVSVYDGKFHDVDSSEAAFKIAGGRAFADAVSKARPAILEPIVDAEITVPSDHMGDVSGDLNTRRGRIQGMDAKGTFQVIKARVPKAGMSEYPRILTSLTSGEGSFTYEEAGYEQVPPNVQQEIVASFKPGADED